MNKVLCLKNGNTILFHFEIDKPLIVKIFDSNYQQVASQKLTCRYLDLTALMNAEFKGLYEIGREAVMFIDQENLGKHRLLRLRISDSNASIVEEKVISESPTLSKRTECFIMKNSGEDNYQILFSTDNPLFNNCTVNVSYYDAQHNVVSEVPININRKDYDRMSVLGAETQPNGTCVTLLLEKMIMNASVHSSGSASAAAKYDHHVTVCYIPRGSITVLQKTINVSADVYPYVSQYTYNAYAKTLNVLMLNYMEVTIGNGLSTDEAALFGQLFFKLDENQLDMTTSWLRQNTIAMRSTIRRMSDTAYIGVPAKMFTNANGLTTIAMESYLHGRFSSVLGNIGVKQVDDDGNIIWDTVLPKWQYMKYSSSYARSISRKKQSSFLFNGKPEEVRERQFCSMNVYNYKRTFCFVYNDHYEEPQEILDERKITIDNFIKSNGCYYKMDRQKNISKHYLFGEPSANEFACTFIEGADFDEQRGVYATLVQYKKGDEISLRMGWSKLD